MERVIATKPLLRRILYTEWKKISVDTSTDARRSSKFV